MSRFIILVSVFLATLSFPSVGHSRDFIDFGPPEELLDVSVHAIAGGSLITENYMGCFKEITEMNTSGGLTLGCGVAAVFGVRDWLGLGTELNLMSLRFRSDLAVSNEDATTVSNIFIKNNTVVANIPVFLQFRFNLLQGVRWTVDAGFYYSYGLSGSQRQSIYMSQVNSLGQLVNKHLTDKVDYYNSSATFINTFRRGDIGLHIATALKFKKKVSLGARLDFGLKNVATIAGNSGIVCPNVHNVGYNFTIGYTL